MHKEQTIHWGIIGLGKIAEKFATDMQKVSNSKIYAVASRTLEKAETFAKKHQATMAYGNYEELLSDPKIDAIYIATPHSLHKENTLMCLQNNIPVLCEKPLALNRFEVENMINAAKENNTLLMEALWTYFLPHYQKVLELLEQKHFGNILKLEADFGFKASLDPSGRVYNKTLGGGSLLDIGIYPIFSALTTLGIPKKTEAKATFFDNGADATCNMIFYYDQAIAHLKSTLVEKTNTEAIFTCETGVIKINSRFHEPTTVTLKSNNGEEKTLDFNYNSIGYNFEIEHFNQLIRTNKKESPIMSFQKSTELIDLLDLIKAQIGLSYQ